MKSLDIDDEFDDYMRKVAPDVEQHSVQYRESRRCFYGGACVVLMHIMQVASDLPENEAEIEIAQLEDQLAEFSDRVKRDAD
jgi:hypothetical protein